MRFRFLSFITCALLMSQLFSGQTVGPGNWWILFGNKNLSSGLNWHHEVQYRSYDFIGNTDQLLLRMGLGYNLSENNNNVLLGYAYVQTFPEDSQRPSNIEHRIYQQFITKQDMGRLHLQHRYRLEQRFLEDDFKLRFRYFLALQIGINYPQIVPGTYYFSSYNEIFLKTEDSYFDRNRIFMGMGYHWNKNIRTELGIMNQTTPMGSRNQFNIITFLQW